MKGYFYTEIIDIESLIVELNSLKLSPKEKRHLAELVDSQIHSTVLETIFSELNEVEKKIFIEHLRVGDNQNIWNHLKRNIDSVEDKIKTATKQLKQELHKDIKEAKERK